MSRREVIRLATPGGRVGRPLVGRASGERSSWAASAGRWSVPVLFLLPVFLVLGAGPISLQAQHSSQEREVGPPSPFTTLAASPPLQVNLSVSAASGIAPLSINVSTSAQGGTAPYSLSLCAGAGVSCENAGTWSGATWSLSGVVYSTPGTYTVSATVTDSAGVGSEVFSTVHVLAAAPLAVAILPIPASGSAPLTVEFAAVVSGGVAPYSLEWEFGDGHRALATDARPLNWTYNATGVFAPTLVVTDHRGVEMTDALPSVTVTPSPSTSELSIAGASIPWWVVATVVTLGLAAIVGSGYAVYERRLREESLALVEALWEGNVPPPGPGEGKP